MLPGKGNGQSKTKIFLLLIFFALSFAGKVQAPVHSDNASSSDQLLVDFSQGANRYFAPGDVVWIWETLQHNNSLYYEGMSSLQRVILFNIPQTADHVHKLTLSHQACEGMNHAYDFITSWPQALKAGTEIAGTSPFVSLNDCALRIGSPITFQDVCVFLHGAGFMVTADVPDTMGFLLGDDVAAKVAAYESYFGNRVIKIYGDAPILEASMSFDGYDGAHGTIDANYTLAWTSRASSIFIEMSGHLAVGVDPLQAGIGYGEGRGSANASSGSYHFKLLLLDGFALGPQDNQIMAGGLLLSPPVCHVTPESETICARESVILAGHGAGGERPYRWEWTKPPGTTVLSTDSTLTIPNAKISDTGRYQAVVIDHNGSANASHAYVSVIPLPQCAIDARADTLCLGDTTTWCGQPDDMESYEWSEPATGFTSTDRCVLLGEGLDPGTYAFTLAVTDLHDVYGCVGTCTRELTILSPPRCVIDSWVDTLCLGDTTTWCGQPDDMESYEWSEPISGFTSTDQYALLGKGLDPGTYAFTLTVTDLHDCAATCTRDLTVLFPPPCAIDAWVDTLCLGDTTTWCGQPDDMESYEWSEPMSGFTSTDQYALLGENLLPGTYAFTLAVTDVHECVSTCTRNLVVRQSAPVVLLKFQATVQQDFIALEWVTTSEGDVERWEVYRSDLEDGRYAKIGELPSDGSVQTIQAYQWVDRTVNPGGVYFYKLKQVDSDSRPWWSHAVSATAVFDAPDNYVLSQNYPNPFNVRTEIRYQLPKSGHVTLKIYNNLGEEVRTLVDMYQTADDYLVIWDGRDDMGVNVAGGIYLYRLRAGRFEAVRKMVFLK